jgi:hypothetical protein
VKSAANGLKPLSTPAEAESLRSVMALCGLTKRHSANAINTACTKALKSGTHRFKDLRRLLGNPIEVQAIGQEVLKAGFLVPYRSIFDLVRELLTQESQVHEGRLLNKYLKPDLLIIDDMGLKILPPKSGEILLEIIKHRYENRSTMMTSNRPIEEWGKLLRDVPAASAILDRLLHHAEIIPINGRSYRLQSKAKQRLQGLRIHQSKLKSGINDGHPRSRAPSFIPFRACFGGSPRK